MSWLHYLLEANIYMAAFYLLYFLLLTNETHYKLNRAYLLITCVIAYIIPLIQVGTLRPANQGENVIHIILNPAFKPGTGADAYNFILQDLVLYGYILGAIVMFGIFVFKLIRLLQLTRAQNSMLDDKYKLVKIEGSNTAFSFFNYVFIGTKVAGTDTIIRHELVHTDQKHSLDIIFLELIKIISWFNPFIYLLQRSLKTVHEYIADEHTAAYENDALTYSSFLVSNAYGISGSSITHSFFNYNLLKKRIIMLNQKRSGNLARLKYLLVVPLCAGLLCVSTLGFSKTYGWVDLSPQKTNDTAKKQNRPAIKNVNLKTGVATQEIKYKLNNKDYYKVIVTDKNGKRATYYSNNISEANRRMLWEKYDFHFSSDTVESITILPPPAIKHKNIPPPPPPIAPKKGNSKEDEITIDEPAPGVKSKASIAKHAVVPKAKTATFKYPPPIVKPNPNVNQASTASTKSTASRDITKKMPPPPMVPIPPPANGFVTLSKYISNHARYPAAARNNHLIGSVIVKFDVNGNNKISNVTLVKGIGGGCSEEIVRVASAYSGEVNVKPGNYKLAVTYSLDGIDAPDSVSESFAKDPSFAGEIVIVGYLSK